MTTRVDPSFADELSQYKVKFNGQIESTFLSDLLSWLLPVALFLGLWIFLLRRVGKQMGGGLMQIGKSKAKIYVETDTKTSFADVAGVDEAKEELQEIVEFLKNPQDYGRLGGRMPKGVLLVGPPGTGEDPARQGRSRRGQGTVLLDFRLGVRGDVRGRGRCPGPRSV